VEQDNELNSVPILALGKLNIHDWIRTQDQDEDLGLVKSWVKDQVKPSKEDIRMQNCSIHMYRQVFELLFIDSAGVLRVNLVNDLGEHGSRICVPYNLFGVVMFISHDMDLAKVSLWYQLLFSVFAGSLQDLGLQSLISVPH